MPNDRPALETWGDSTSPLRHSRLLLAGAVVALVLVGRIWIDNRAMRSELEAMRSAQAESVERERAFARSVALKHQELQGVQTEMDTLRWRMGAVELQLDGVDRLSTDVRRELGMPDGEGTWSGAAPLGTPQGGPGAELGVTDRAVLAQMRLATGLQELQLLLDTIRRRADPEVAAPEASQAASVPLGEPIRGAMTSDFGWRIFRGRPEYHTGVDISAPIGSPVLASAAGTVVGSGWQPSYGWCVLVQHAGGFHTLFAHLSERSVRNGDRVVPGDVIGLTGSSGRSTGPHLHYEIWKDGQLQDPAVYMSPLPVEDGRD